MNSIEPLKCRISTAPMCEKNRAFMPLIQIEYQYDGALQGEVWGNLWGIKCELSQVIIWDI